jgi:exonuclease VII small subunit
MTPEAKSYEALLQDAVNNLESAEPALGDNINEYERMAPGMSVWYVAYTTIDPSDG